eukprot:5384628-Lingulodinium_polyedra.AAC.1
MAECDCHWRQTLKTLAGAERSLGNGTGSTSQSGARKQFIALVVRPAASRLKNDDRCRWSMVLVGNDG